jgi:hypothetical protein
LWQQSLDDSPLFVVRPKVSAHVTLYFRSANYARCGHVSRVQTHQGDYGHERGAGIKTRINIPGIGSLAALRGSSAIALADDDMAGDFQMYYEQRVASRSYGGPLSFLGEAAASHADTVTVLKAGRTRAVIVDRGNGYLWIELTPTRF